uniref:Limb region 1 protein homolog n=1 Tax=Phallusia mammillata TaxID=59560 RepID=A0A6F9DJ53_9ASCI|nr:limb region 1 protein homolog [Phallusia mammillata]
MFEWAIATDDAYYQQSIEEKEEEFNNVVRENIIALLTFIVLYICSYFIILRYHEKRERDGLYDTDEDAQAYRISFYLCCFTLAVSCGSIFMLPMSMIGNEVVHLHPDSYWVQWLNGALIHTFWQWTFRFSNLSLFVLLPFSYFFTESEGFSGYRRGLMPRVYETLTVLLLLLVLVFGFSVLALAFFDKDDSAQKILVMVSESYLQYLYSFLLCASVFFMVAGCAPIGFITLFDAVGHLLVKPKIFENNDEKIAREAMEEEALQQKLKSKTFVGRLSPTKYKELQQKLHEVHDNRMKLEKRKKASSFERNIGYPLVVLIILALTGLALFLVSIHILKLVFIGDHELHPSTVKEEFGKDYRKFQSEKTCPRSILEQPAKPANSHWWKFWAASTLEKEPPKEEGHCPDAAKLKDEKSHFHSLGAASLSTFGLVGTLLEAVVILYLMLASVIGFYKLPGFKNLRPIAHETTMTKLIANCYAMQLLSASLPVLSRVLGITDFDLQGKFGTFSWLGDFHIIFAFNVIFAAVTALCLVSKVTAKIRYELYKALQYNRNVIVHLALKHKLPLSSASSPAGAQKINSSTDVSFMLGQREATEAELVLPDTVSPGTPKGTDGVSTTPLASRTFLTTTAPKTAHH